MKVQTLEIQAGKTCKIDAGNLGTNVEGPAVVIIVKEKDLDNPSPARNDTN